MKRFIVIATWDESAAVWCGRNDEIPLATEGPTFDELVARVMAVAPEIIVMNGLAPPGDEVEIIVSTERGGLLTLPAA
jgi:Domain of unknown function (DUF1902)